MVGSVDADHADPNDPPDWRAEIKAFLTNRIAPDDPTEAKRLRTQASRYVVIAAGVGIQHKTTSIEHHQTKGQAESANKVILKELKKRLGEAKGAWAEQLPEVLWAYRCTPQSTTQETPFCVVYGSDAMIPVEIREPSFRRAHFDEASNEVELRTNLDVVEEFRD
ncbi:uncharacterized protein LOC109793188 [Cajanus cajan]|uniref:uncharacterized protein LOC109793188 n=1 Tax=Cajanus cajan TaxID=3821 RepID=UPI00098DD0EE|nr:uncharacterized protein LOC109793188 [Cajanus cajan]